MALVRRQPSTRTDPWTAFPFGQLSTLRDELSSFLEDPFSVGAPQFFQAWAPALDLYEDKDKLTVKLEAPGLKKEEIDISLEDDVLSVSGERKEEKQEGENYRRERYFGKFYRSVQLPCPVQADRVDARYEDGVLTITLPKAEEARRKQISIK